MTAWTNFVRDNINSMPGTTPQQRMKACATAYRGSSGKTVTHKVKNIRKKHSVRTQSGSGSGWFGTNTVKDLQFNKFQAEMNAKAKARGITGVV